MAGLVCMSLHSIVLQHDVCQLLGPRLCIPGQLFDAIPPPVAAYWSTLYESVLHLLS